MKRFVAISLLLLTTALGVSRGQALLVNDLAGVLVDAHHVTVSWTPQSTAMALYRSEPSATGDVLVGNIAPATSNYSDFIPRQYCSDSLRYYLRDAQSDDICSNVCPVLVYDPQPTAACAPLVATVDEASQKVVLSWEPSPDPDIMGYYICSGSPCIDYDTAWGPQNTSYTCLDFPSTEVHTFRVLAFDSCMNPSPLTENYNNIVVSVQNIDCQPELIVSWNAYNAMPGGLERYVVQVRYDGDPLWQDAAVNQPGNLQANLQVPGNVASLDIRVLASNVGGTLEAYSNILHYDYSTADSARFIYVSHASVAQDGASVDLSLYVDADFPAQHYTLYRSVDGSRFERIATIPYAGTERFSYVDRGVSAATRRYAYRLSVLDGCGRNEKFSNTAITMPCSLIDEGTSVALTWEPYEGWGPDVDYVLYRRGQSEEAWTILFSGPQVSYSDDLSLIPSLNEGLYYRVMAKEPSGANYGFSDTAYTATMLFSRGGSAYFPNAFTPDCSENNTFRPIYTFLNATDYLITIYSRSGELVFSSTDPSESWDGTTRGMRLPQGAYVYTVRCHFLNNIIRHYTGTVLLIR